MKNVFFRRFCLVTLNRETFSAFMMIYSGGARAIPELFPRNFWSHTSSVRLLHVRERSRTHRDHVPVARAIGYFLVFHLVFVLLLLILCSVFCCFFLGTSSAG